MKLQTLTSAAFVLLTANPGESSEETSYSVAKSIDKFNDVLVSVGLYNDEVEEVEDEYLTWANFDPAHIHTNCQSGVGYCWHHCSRGKGWYCLDGVHVSKHTDTDTAYIHEGCDSDTMGAHYSPLAKAWHCMDDSEFGEVDRAFIHGSCGDDGVSYPEYRRNDYCQNTYGSDCAFGDGWYCNDDKDVSGYGLYDFDPAFIHTGCDSNTVGVHYDNNLGAWYCNN